MQCNLNAKKINKHFCICNDVHFVALNIKGAFKLGLSFAEMGQTCYATINWDLLLVVGA